MEHGSLCVQYFCGICDTITILWVKSSDLSIPIQTLRKQVNHLCYMLGGLQATQPMIAVLDMQGCVHA